jgi:hypothetical protein
MGLNNSCNKDGTSGSAQSLPTALNQCKACVRSTILARPYGPQTASVCRLAHLQESSGPLDHYPSQGLGYDKRPIQHKIE